MNMKEVPIVPIIGVAVAITGVAVVGYIGYRMVKVVSKVGTGENVKSAGSSIWNARPKVIFKGTDSIIGGLMK